MLSAYRNSLICLCSGVMLAWLVALEPFRLINSKGKFIQQATDSLVDAVGRSNATTAILAIALLLAWLVRPSPMQKAAAASLATPTLAGIQPEPTQPEIARRRMPQASAYVVDETPQSPVVIRSADNPLPPAPPVDRSIDLAWRSTIAFRTISPFDDDSGMSFWGGLPIAPDGFEWPVLTGKNGEPYTPSFFAQWDCTSLSRQDSTGLLPQDGVLYLFCDLEWGGELPFRFIHVPGPIGDWREVPAPSSLGPAYGAEGAWMWPQVIGELDKERPATLPRVMPKWPFVPLHIDIPPSRAEDPEDRAYEDRIWRDDEAMLKALLTAERATGIAHQARADTEPRWFERPFPAFPQDWSAVRILCAVMDRALHWPSPSLKRQIAEDDEEANEIVTQWREEARELHGFAASHPLFAAVPADLCDDIWAWLEQRRPAFDLSFHRHVEIAVRATVGARGEALAAIPDALGELAAQGTPLARELTITEYGTGEEKLVIHAPAPHRMFGPPRDPQGYVEEAIGGKLLLFEFSSFDPASHFMGDGVVQFLIAPEDLRAGRFDKAEWMGSAY